MRQGLVLLLCFMAYSAFAGSIQVDIFTVENNTPIGTIAFTDTAHGLLITPNLQSVRPGLHGLHIHQHFSCAALGNAAGPHYDPKQTGKHLGPYQNGHLGDLPVLYVDQSGSSQQAVLAPRLQLKDIDNHSVIIRQSGDNYRDKPLLLGGSSEKIACGLISTLAKQLAQ